MICGDTTFTQWGGHSGSVQIIENRVRHLTRFEFCLKIYDLWRQPTYGSRVIVWVSGWGHVKSLEIQ